MTDTPASAGAELATYFQEEIERHEVEAAKLCAQAVLRGEGTYRECFSVRADDFERKVHSLRRELFAIRVNIAMAEAKP